eukprot:scaffold69056_cov37-Tisochrysis_lutea.AAC.2
MTYRLTCFFEEPLISGKPVTPARKNSFFTVWNYELQIVLWIVALGSSLLYRQVQPQDVRDIRQVEAVDWGPLFAEREGGASHVHRLNRLSSGVAWAHHLLLSVCLPSAVLVSIVLWTILYPADLAKGHGDRELNFASFNQHAINTALLLLDFSANQLLVTAQLLYLSLAWACAYVVFTWIEHIWTGIWPYFFLDLSGWMAIVWYGLLVLTYAIVFFAVVAASHLKARAFGLTPGRIENTVTASQLPLRVSQTRRTDLGEESGTRAAEHVVEPL